MSNTVKLHELLAVKPTREGEADKLLKGHVSAFKGKHHLFASNKKVFNPSTEEEGTTVLSVVEEETTLVTTVAKEARFVLEKFGNLVDLQYTIDCANTEAKADIVIDDQTLAADVPSTFLVHLEKRVNQVIELLNSMPTCDPAAGFISDPDMGANVLKARVITRPRTAKIKDWKEVSAATKEHKAQIVETVVERTTGTVEHHAWSGMPTTEEKADLLQRAIAVKTAVVEARARANGHSSEQKKIFGSIQTYILSGFRS